jgi:hypothetical protein
MVLGHSSLATLGVCVHSVRSPLIKSARCVQYMFGVKVVSGDVRCGY